MHRQRTILFSVLALFAVWAAALMGMNMSQSFQPTPEKVVETVEANPLSRMNSPEDRAAVIDGVVWQMNQLTQEERQMVRIGEYADRMKPFFDEMTTAERSRFVRGTMPSGVRQMIDAFDAMSPEDQQKLVKKALKQLSEIEGDNGLAAFAENLDPQVVQTMVRQGIDQYLSDDGGQAQMQMQPLIEQIQSVMRSPDEHRRRRVREHFRERGLDDESALGSQPESYVNEQFIELYGRFIVKVSPEETESGAHEYRMTGTFKTKDGGSLIVNLPNGRLFAGLVKDQRKEIPASVIMMKDVSVLDESSMIAIFIEQDAQATDSKIESDDRH